VDTGVEFVMCPPSADVISAKQRSPLEASFHRYRMDA